MMLRPAPQTAKRARVIQTLRREPQGFKVDMQGLSGTSDAVLSRVPAYYVLGY